MNYDRTLKRILAPIVLFAAAGCTANGEDPEPATTSQGALSATYAAEISNGTLRITAGSSGNTKVALRLQAGAANILEVDLGDDGAADFRFDRDQFDHIVVEGGSGDDVIRIDESNGGFTDTEATTLRGGKGNDTLRGGSFAETLEGGPGNDTIHGGRGDDLLLGGDGNDTFEWYPGDGSDVLEGQGGTDTLFFHGGNIAETFTLAANGPRLRLTRDVGTVAMDAGGIEKIALDPRGGADDVVVKDLSGTGVMEVSVDFAAMPGVATGDALPDSVVLEGTPGADTIDVSATAGEVVAAVSGAQIRVKGYEPDDRIAVDGVGGDVVNVNGSAGPDVMRVAVATVAELLYARVTATGFSASVDVRGASCLYVNGLDGADTIGGGTSLSAVGIPIVIDGGRGNDVLEGGGVDRLLGGPGDDTFVWFPGGGNDVIDGQGGRDVLVFHGANIGENIALSSNASRLRLTRDVANIVLDVGSVESVEIDTRGGSDHVTVNDLSGTSVVQVTVELAEDTLADLVTVNATTGSDKLAISAVSGAVVVDGLAAQVRIAHAEPALDQLVVDGLGGGDKIALGSGLDAVMSVSVTP